MNRRLAFVLATCFSFLLAGQVFAKDTWTSVRSKNFQLVGNASEKDIRRVAVQLEQFREVFSRLFTSLKVNSPIPTTVIVFKNYQSYRNFKPNSNTAGYFQPGPDVNYITLSLGNETQSEQNPFTIIFHEYTHLLVKNTSGNVPTWFNEGLAEYYSTFSISEDQKVVMGRAIPSHVFLLRKTRMLPLRTLFQVDQKSPYYNERDKQSVFYAQSWALIHYLILGNDGKRMRQMEKFVDLLTGNVPMEQAFQQAFAMSVESLEKELRSYIQRDHYPILNGTFNSRISYDTALQTTPLTEAEVQAYLGDLLMHSNREDGETYLEKALVLDPNLAMANASMGMLRVRQGKAQEARKCLERAVAASKQNYLIHYYYAYALSREGNSDMQTVLGFAPETAAIMRSELKQAIELRPDFPESYSLLAFVNLVTGTELDETLKLLQHALTVSPDRNDLAYMLAQVYVRKQDFKTARELIDKLNSCSDEGFRKRSQELLAHLVSVEAQLAQTRIAREEGDSESRNSPLVSGSSSAGGGEVLVEEFDPAAVLRETLRKPATGETRDQGTLARIDCDASGITFVVRTNDRLLKLRTDSFRHLNLTTFSDDARGQVTCGLRKPKNNVVVSYLPATGPQSKVDGVIKSVEFVPPDFTLRPTP